MFIFMSFEKANGKIIKKTLTAVSIEYTTI